MRKLLVLLTLVAGGLLWAALPASAACHAFSLKATPASVAEGATVTLTVGRDGAVSPSQVRLTSIDDSATGGADFAKVDQVVSFTTELEKTITVPITDDTATETAETFRLHIGEGAGCPVNTRYTYGADVSVTIQANDTATTTSTSVATTTTTVRAGTSTTGRPATTAPGSVTVGTAPTSSTSPSTTSTTVAAATQASDDDDSGEGGEERDGRVGYGIYLIGLITIALLAVGAFVAHRFRTRGRNSSATVRG